MATILMIFLITDVCRHAIYGWSRIFISPPEISMKHRASSFPIWWTPLQGTRL